MVQQLAHRPLDGNIRKALPRYRRVLALYEGGVPWFEIIQQEHISKTVLYRLLKRALALRAAGRM